jgi:predicted metalloprotease with PDZ domain
MQNVDAVPPVALEDASLSTWIHPQDETGYLYYPKGALAGFLLDVMIRDASDNRRSLDTVMRELYQSTYQRGRGFTGAEWWSAVSRAAGGRSFADFAARYVDGREPYPWAQVLPLAGLRLQTDSTRAPRLGVNTEGDSTGVRVVAVVPGGVADRAGIRVGDQLLRLGEVTVTDPDFGPAYRARYGTAAEGTPLAVVVRRNGQQMTLNGTVQFVTQTQTSIVPDPNAPAKAVRIRNGIARGTTGGG